jgi:CRP/FNR family transcriptional regulator
MYELQNFTKDLIFYDTATRLARLIVHHFENNTLYLIDDLSMDTLAKMIGSSRKVVNLHMIELKKEGIIETVAGRLQVKNSDKLYKKAHEERIGDA